MARSNKIEAKSPTRYSFVAAHRGGPLSKENHRKLIKWASVCAEHVLSLVGNAVDERLLYALKIAAEWEKGNVATGVAMKASLGSHAAAKESDDPISKAVARAVGHAVATAHMADHSLGGAFYALKAVKLANMDVAKEKNWQIEKLRELPIDLIEIVQTMWTKKELDRRI